ncbi:hypothetical protein [Caulobacter sp. S45]|uniref:hypothetical protein n=1 Tax=Caulobacter sp. S45 TaxID=1641861 RepID=UPI00131D9139|nr:hypothetical protein [Caulobacter sp. S45]
MSRWDWIWPVLERPDDEHLVREGQRLQQDLDSVRSAKFDDDIDVLLAEARRLFDAEGERRKGADTRATGYLTVVGVLITLLAAVAPVALGPTKDISKTLVTLALFAAAASYLFGGAIWAFRTLRVAISHRLDVNDLIEIWATPARKTDLVKGILACVRYERRVVNEKISFIKMTHAFGLRAVAVFLIAIVVRTAWDPVAVLWKLAH